MSLGVRMAREHEKYQAVVGVNYVPAGGDDEIRVEAGKPCPDLPKKAADALLKMGAIEEVDAAKIAAVKGDN